MDLVGLVAVLGAFSVPIYALKTRADSVKRKHELEAGGGGGAGPGAQKQIASLVDENKLLRANATIDGRK